MDSASLFSARMQLRVYFIESEIQPAKAETKAEPEESSRRKASKNYGRPSLFFTGLLAMAPDPVRSSYFPYRTNYSNRANIRRVTARCKLVHCMI